MDTLCPKCGQEIASSQVCPNCGYPYEKNEQTYQKAVSMMQKCTTPLGFRGCAEVFDSILEHRDSTEKAAECYAFAESFEGNESNEYDAGNELEQSKEISAASTPAKKSKAAIYLGIAVCVVFTVLIVTYVISAANLKKNLVKTWYAPDESIIKVLDITDNQMEYRFETGYDWLNMTAAVFDWKPVFGNRIKVSYGSTQYTYKVELNKDKDILTFYPALTNVGTFETWYLID